MKKILLILFLLTGTQAGAFDFEAGRNLGLSRMPLFSKPMASDLLVCPGVNLNDGKILIESGFQRRFELKDLDKAYGAAAYRYHFVFGAIGFSQFGRSDYYTESQFKGILGAQYRQFNLAIIMGSKNIEFGNDYGKYSMTSIGIGGGAKLKSVRFGFSADNLNKPKLTSASAAEQPTVGLYTEIESVNKFSMTGRATFEKYEKPSLAIGQIIRLAGDNGLFWGIGGNPLTYGGGIEMHYSSFMINYAVSYHPVLGFSHNVAIGFAAGK
ncbi:exported hypothetical protein [Candidatus Zixiibacteriota bacterium]|nr:exported hypothetical protein [candidate division Zixibacteria bacterium]